MIFKSYRLWIKLIVGLTLVLPFSACDFLKGRPKKDEYIEVKKESLTCLKGLSKKFKAILKSELSQNEVDDSFVCLDQVLNEFQSRVQGTADANTFSKTDLFEIFNKFLSDANISHEATSDILRLKAALLGGSDQTLAKTEITTLKEFLVVIKGEVRNLLPYVKIFNFKKGNQEFSKEFITQAFAQLDSSLRALKDQSLLTRADYRFEDLKRLVLNLKLLDDDQNDFLDLGSDVNDVLVGNDLLKTETDYNTFITSFANVLKLYTVFQQGFVNFEISNAKNMSEIFEFVQGWINVLENSNQFKKNKIISVETLDPLILKIATKGIIPIDLAPETLRDFYKTIVVRALEAGPAGDVTNFVGITKVHLINLKKEVAIYKSYAAFIATLPFPISSKENPNGGLDITAIQNQLKVMPASVIADSLKSFDAVSQTQVTAAFNELRFEFLQPRPVVYRYGKMVIAANQEIWKQNWNDLSRALYAKMLARELLIGWGDGISTRLLQTASIKEAGLVKWYSEFKQFGVQAKLFDPRTVNAGAKSFKEANLFTYAANGDDKLDYLESVQYLNILVSAGGTSVNELKDGFAKAGCNLSDKDVFLLPWNQENCAYEDFKKNYNRYFNNLSYLVAHLGKLNDQQLFSFYDSVMNVARTDKVNKGQRLETADLRNFAVLLHYMEVLYATFDADRNFNFSAAEIRSAYPRFKSFATDFAMKTAKDKLDLFATISAVPVTGLGYSCYSQADLIRESFIYLVYNGKTPGVTDLNITPCFGSRSLIDFNGEVNRSDIINTFKILKDVIGS
ncbi:MAG: hypothetical protein H7256_07455 [Bdellovibrio sp.]|nr:hypothetical protein [Bdellovibrio sp.]